VYWCHVLYVTYDENRPSRVASWVLISCFLIWVFLMWWIIVRDTATESWYQYVEMQPWYKYTAMKSRYHYIYAFPYLFLYTACRIIWVWYIITYQKKSSHPPTLSDLWETENNITESYSGNKTEEIKSIETTTRWPNNNILLLTLFNQNILWIISFRIGRAIYRPSEYSLYLYWYLLIGFWCLLIGISVYSYYTRIYVKITNEKMRKKHKLWIVCFVFTYLYFVLI